MFLSACSATRTPCKPRDRKRSYDNGALYSSWSFDLLLLRQIYSKQPCFILACRYQPVGLSLTTSEVSNPTVERQSLRPADEKTPFSEPTLPARYTFHSLHFALDDLDRPLL